MTEKNERRVDLVLEAMEGARLMAGVVVVGCIIAMGITHLAYEPFMAAARVCIGGLFGVALAGGVVLVPPRWLGGGIVALGALAAGVLW